MGDIFAAIARRILLVIGKTISRLLLKVEISGLENIPDSDEPLILISNHFSWFDPHILTVLLPIRPTFLVATESQSKLSIRLFTRLFNLIPIWRGQVDRQAFRSALEVLEKGGVVGIFPEGGIDPEHGRRVTRGEAIAVDHLHTYGLASRHSAQLVKPRPGTAFLAVQTDARILPVGLLGTERIIEEKLHWRNLRTFWRRPIVKLHVGQVFGPLTIDPTLTGRDKRYHLDLVADNLMQHIADLFPPENRGPYGA